MSEIPYQLDDLPRAAPPSIARQILADTFGNLGAKLGLVWIIIVGFVAIAAPFLANSHPYIMKADGRWSSPLLRYLTPTDAILLLGAIAAMVLCLVKGMSFGQKSAVLTATIAILIPVCSWDSVVDQWQWWCTDLGRRLVWSILVTAMALDLGLLALMVRQLRLSPRGWAILAGVWAVLVVVLTIFPVNPPDTVVYEHERDLANQGRVQYALLAPVPYSANDRLEDFSDRQLMPPSRANWLGTEEHGSDVLSCMIHASRIAMAVGLIATGISIILGIIVGGIMGYFVGRVDILGMRLIEIFEAIPTLFLIITFVAFFGRNLYLIMAIIGFTGWTGDARFIRAEFLRLRNQDFVHAAVASGLPLRSILFRHLLPNGVAPLLVSASFGIAGAIFTESVLSFLGLGLVDEPSWGKLLNQAIGATGAFVWWVAIFPGFAIFLTMFAYNLIGEAMRDALDPKLAK